jgi:BirA family biotin operon repressor/biotin-[acetyl-CoA-carboxylase] ligase
MYSAQRIAEQLAPAAACITIEIVPETGSTNTDLLKRLPALTAPTLLVAHSQTQGRGRAGRAWLSAPEASLTFSLAWKFRLPLTAFSGLSLAVGVVVAQTLTHYGVRAELKWPNDILLGEGKLGGVLIETAETPDGTWAVVGIGLNLALPDSLEALIGQPVAESRWLAQLDRNDLLAALLNRLAESFLQFETEGFQAFAGRWNKFHAHSGREVRLLEGDRVRYEGVAVGVDGSGRLLLDTTSGRVAVMAGDVSLRATGR